MDGVVGSLVAAGTTTAFENMLGYVYGDIPPGDQRRSLSKDRAIRESDASAFSIVRFGRVLVQFPKEGCLPRPQTRIQTV